MNQLVLKPDSNGNVLTIDGTTGEVLSEEESPLTFRNLEEAEKYIFETAGQEESLKIKQIKALLAVKNQKLYTSAFDEEGNPIASFESYLKNVSRRLIPLDGAKPRSLKSWMARIRIYQDQLGYDDTMLLRLGYHAEIMLPAAARGNDMQLSEDDEPTDTGGTRLGRNNFAEFVDEIRDLVFKSQDDPSFNWGVADTKARVSELLQRLDRKAEVELKCKQVGEDFVVESVVWWVDGQPFEIGSRTNKDDFQLIAATAKTITGLGDGWKSGS